MKIYVCNICGEVYLGTNLPPSCPFCGVTAKQLRFAHDWEDGNVGVVLSEKSKKNLEEALRLELSNTAFYFCAADKLTNKEASKMFKGLAKVEREHASVFRKLLKLESVPEIKEECPADPADCIEQSYQRETRAVAFYSKALAEASEARIREVFEAIMNVEKDHIALDEEMKKKFEK
ncbi:MAG TPA: ferritin family protein [Candidatus Nanoarchaeia archaeon]|nr:ferritin family protein [Candidatus Nanoarchaeia archaeon]